MKAQDSRSQEIQSFLSENGLPANFCIAPWINGDLDQLGTIFACHRYDDKKLPLGNWKDQLFSEEFNSKNYQKLRGMFHNNEKPRSCQTCWDKEDYGNKIQKYNSRSI
jgi:radical SAM protein with 4Fe4S-binding SPASM domain